MCSQEHIHTSNARPPDCINTVNSLRINIGKTRVLRLNTKSHRPIMIEERPLEHVVEFVYLGSNSSTDGGADKDVALRISKARHAFRTLRPVWLSSQLSRNTKIRIFNTNVKSVLLYSHIPTRRTFPAMRSRGCGLERGFAQDPPLRDSYSGSERPPAEVVLF